MKDATQAPGAKPRYLWPWFIAAAAVLAMVIAVLAVRAEANRIKLQRTPQLAPADK